MKWSLPWFALLLLPSSIAVSVAPSASIVPGGRGQEVRGLPPPARMKNLLLAGEDNAILFEHATHDLEFPGWVFRLPDGLCNAELGFEDNEASAVYVPPGKQAVLYDLLLPDGRRKVLGPGMHNLEDRGFNDLLSSVEVAAFVGQERGEIVLYAPSIADPEVTDEWRYGVDRATPEVFLVAPRDFRNDALTGVRVPAGFEAVLMYNGGKEGRALVLREGLHELAPFAFERAVSAVRILRLDVP